MHAAQRLGQVALADYQQYLISLLSVRMAEMMAVACCQIRVRLCCLLGRRPVTTADPQGL